MKNSTVKFPREALADALEKIAAHARRYEIEGLSVEFDGSMYRVSFYGEGVSFEGIDSADTEAEAIP